VPEKLRREGLLITVGETEGDSMCPLGNIGGYWKHKDFEAKIAQTNREVKLAAWNGRLYIDQQGRSPSKGTHEEISNVKN